MSTAMAVRNVRCREIDELVSGLSGLSAVALSLRASQAGGTLATLALDDITIQVVRGTPMLMMAEATPGRTALLKAVSGTERARWNGGPLGADRVFVCDPSRQHEAVYPDDFACLLLSFGEAANDALASRAPRAETAARARRDGVAQDAALRALDRAAGAVETMLAEAGQAPIEAEAVRGLRASVIAAADAALPPAGRAARSDGARQRLVHAADDFLRANPARPIYTEDLCAALSTSATRLHQAFHLTFGLSPHRYLKLRRLGMVRATLLSRSGPWRSVKAVALSHGFWHLSQFAHDYRDAYGELPSETLARAAPARGIEGDGA